MIKTILKQHPLRCALWIAAAILLAAVAVCLHAGSAEIVVNRQRINLPRLAEADDGLRVAVLSDPHFSSGDADRAAMLADKLNALDPDIIILLGDFVNGIPDRRRSLPPEELTGFVRRLRAKSGIFAVTGNHELWYGRDIVIDALRAGGATVLHNECVTVATPSGRPLQIVGLPDYTTEEHPEKFPATDGRIPVMVIMHDPRSAEFIPENVDCFGIAGHTHGGQLRLYPGGDDRTSLRLAALRLKAKLGMLSPYNRPYVCFDRGFTEYRGHRLFITSGAGLSRLRLRLFCPPEVALLQFHCADPDAARNEFAIPEEL